jgi:nucleotide-binding universal stress UspA family protein
VFDNVVIGVDGRSGGRAAVALAGQLAAPGARVTFAHVYVSGGIADRGGGLVVLLERQAAERVIAEQRAASSLDSELSLVVASTVSRGLHELAESHNADLLVVGSCHRGPIGRVLAGNDAVATLHGAPCPVAIAPAGYEDHLSKLTTLGVGENASPEGALALKAALALGKGLGAAVRVCSINGEPSDELLRLSEDVDLMVVGSRGRGPLGRLVNGSTSNYLAQRVHCPLLVVPRPNASEAEQQHTTLNARG